MYKYSREEYFKELTKIQNLALSIKDKDGNSSPKLDIALKCIIEKGEIFGYSKPQKQDIEKQNFIITIQGLKDNNNL